MIIKTLREINKSAHDSFIAAKAARESARIALLKAEYSDSLSKDRGAATIAWEAARIAHDLAIEAEYAAGENARLTARILSDALRAAA